MVVFELQGNSLHIVEQQNLANELCLQTLTVPELTPD